MLLRPEPALLRKDAAAASGAHGRETKRALIQLKAADLGADGTFSGYGSVFDVVDSGGDIVRPGAFAASIAARKASGDWPRLLHEHDPAHPIGVWDSIGEDGYGLLVKGRLVLDVVKAREVYALAKAGHPYGLSIGYEIGTCGYCHPDDIEQKYGFAPSGPLPYLPTGQVRAIETLDLWEISVVTFPMCVEARVEAVKAAPAKTAAALDLAPLAAALARREAAIKALLH